MHGLIVNYILRNKNQPFYISLNIAFEVASGGFELDTNPMASGKFNPFVD